MLVLVTYHREDPAWSHSVADTATRNAGGPVGAWLADVLLYLFGISAYWLVALGALAVVWGHRRFDARAVGIGLGGFALLIFASASLEGLRLHSLGLELPHAPGGVVGVAAGNALGVALGYTGATLLLLALAAAGLSLFTGISWLSAAERVGCALEAAWVSTLRAWERRQDRRLGALAREERDLVVQAEKKREETHPPLRIEPPVAEIRKSERVLKEKQAPLFDELPDTPLPPLKLL
ncbi:MAG TPA: DNA translocase FtsK 4TM domain-containing protein, partial [Burkholderiales bacterium]|nr:DNA translocase FtsK 4TM domain-containing protein [Burkholderiales bacterium]